MIHLDIKNWEYIKEKHFQYVKCVIVPVLNKLVDNNQHKKQKPKEKQKDIKITSEQILFIKEIFFDIHGVSEEKMRKIFCSEDLISIINNFEKKLEEYFNIYMFNEEECDKQKKDINNIITHIMNYEKFNYGAQIEKKENERWGRHEFVLELGVRVCPYCNRQYITEYENENGQNKTTPDTDHYYCKDKYPILSMNIYNLVPSCGVCNSKMKGNKVKNSKDAHLYPYIDGSDSIYFNTKFDTLETLFDFNEDDIEIFVLKNLSKSVEVQNRVQNSLRIFRIEELYKTHKNQVFTIKKNIKLYYRMNYYNNIFSKNYSGYLNMDEIYNSTFDFLSGDITKEPLTKMKQDIYNQIYEIVSKLY